MNLHVVEIAATVAPGARAVRLVDQTGCSSLPPNIIMMVLPPKCLELAVPE
jgi:hypothetical protein